MKISYFRTPACVTPPRKIFENDLITIQREIEGKRKKILKGERQRETEDRERETERGYLEHGRKVLCLA